VDVGVVVMNEVDTSRKKIRKQLEVDFVCNKGSKRYYIQSAYALPDKEKMNQEQRSLINTGDGFKKIIITKDAVAPLYNEEGILVMGLFDFLLNPDSMDI
jgi:predicted AAA+ superfamily ATPase